ncbi:unnamed protein product, partial [Schistosoma mattheei]
MNPPDIEASHTDLPIDVNPPTTQEIRMDIRQIKSGKAARPDNISAEVLKSDIEVTINMLHLLFMKEIASYKVSNSKFDIPTEMTSNKYYDSDEITELSPHHLGVYDEDQLEKNEFKNNSIIELELARLRITQLEKEIELEKLRCQRYEGSGQSVSNSENTVLKNLYLPKREVVRFDGTPTNYWNFIKNYEECIGSENIGFRAKLNYLIQYCDGEAKAAILHCTILEPEIGYHQALKLLQETFGQKHVVARMFIDNLLNIPDVRRNQPDGLRRLSRETQARGLTLEQMNY